MSLALAPPHPTPLRGATLPARGRDGSAAIRLALISFVQSRVFEFIRYDKAAPIPPLYGEGGARSATGGVLSQKTPLMANAKARALRKSMTPQEVKLWAQLRQLRPQGFHFRRQAPLEGYILDFVCFKCRIIVEADGSQHGEDDGLAHDARRDAFFAAQGFRTLRFWNHEIDADLHGVIETIIARTRENASGLETEL